MPVTVPGRTFPSCTTLYPATVPRSSVAAFHDSATEDFDTSEAERPVTLEGATESAGTVTCTVSVAVLPASSSAVAVMVWLPSPAADQLAAYGALVSVPTVFPSTLNVTEVTSRSSLAVAVMEVGP